MTELISPDRARTNFVHPETADRALPAVATVAALAAEDDLDLEVCS
ncbi:hypothetical protein IT072_03845 [Leifsonia sp. ZF2019]|nr:hypothetical protein [Leifsonia sp. ZF2019]UAJ80191.1 hypothetical protein IT072_03845 [Leifsonia sp. ZF2019]